MWMTMWSRIWASLRALFGRPYSVRIRVLRKGPDQKRGYKQAWVFHVTKQNQAFEIVTADDLLRGEIEQVPAATPAMEPGKLVDQSIIDQLRKEVVVCRYCGGKAHPDFGREICQLCWEKGMVP